jgi:hypothetical protein
MKSHRVFRGISDISVKVVFDRREYEVLGRLVDGPTMSSSSSSEEGSGTARFFPLESCAGSLIVKGTEVGKVTVIAQSMAVTVY